MNHVCTPTYRCENRPCPLDDAIGPAVGYDALTYSPKHLGERTMPVDRDWSSLARPENVPPVHIETGMCVGRHRAFVSDAAEAFIRVVAKRSPMWLRRDESGCAALAPLLVAAVMVGVLFLGVSAFLNAITR